MLNCELCNYYKSLIGSKESESSKNSVCELFNFIFTKDLEELDMEYPCCNSDFV